MNKTQTIFIVISILIIYLPTILYAGEYYTNFMVHDFFPDASHHAPAVTSLNDSSFIVVWRDTRYGERSIYYQRYDSKGNPIGANTPIIEYVATSTSTPVIAGSDSSFVIAWTVEFDNYEVILFQLFSNTGLPITEFSTLAVTSDYKISVDMIKDGSFAICWLNKEADNIMLQYFDNKGELKGDAIVIMLLFLQIFNSILPISIF